MKKTVLEWLNELPEPYRTQALKEMEKPEFAPYKNELVPSMFDAVSTFGWSDADSCDDSLKPDQSRFDYWEELCERY